MAAASFRFFAELNDFLAPGQRGRAFVHRFHRRASIKDMIEALGVPHPEVALIRIDGAAAGFDAVVRHGQRIHAYPAFARLGVPTAELATPPPPEPVRFVLDAHLGALARHLRHGGMDARYRNDFTDAELARVAANEHRVLLTRDRDALKRRLVTWGYFVRSDAPWDQIAEVLARFGLEDRLAPFTRCPRCNGVLDDVAKEAVAERLEPLTRRYYDTFRQCRDCGQVYWRGSHVAGLERRMAQARRGSAPSE